MLYLKSEYEYKACGSKKNIQIKEWTYAKNQFLGPFYDFREKIVDNKSFIQFERAYSEDSKYSNLSRFEMAVNIIEELLENKERKLVILEIWGHELQCSKGEDIREKLKSFIIKHLAF